ncbi:MAG TPA: polymer-forming cytoskeletal protein [Candidatus Omnitrophota bacterium]|nr:polymer-forming cytoskeletal protein [Candidatus Omnitrophota bacterium]
MKKLEAINSIIGDETSFRGEISSPGSLHVSGEVRGNIKVKGDVFVFGKGRVIGDISGARVVVSGLVEGNIFASAGLEILKSGKINGEITCDKLVIEEGSVYQGRVNVRSGAEAAPAPEFEIKDV